jgi:hypothetical protein
VKLEIDVKGWQSNNKVFSAYINRVKDFCCDDMQSALYHNFVVVSEESLTLSIRRVDAYPEGAAVDFMLISRCPFCGKHISTKIIELGVIDNHGDLVKNKQ